MVIADETVAYVGSGEIRENSFLTNGEAGVLTVTAAEVVFWRDFFDLFWEEATDVEKTVARAQSH
jgi:limonene-1,2-epoxide hydrolase